MKNVLLPIKKDKNPFFKEIINHAQSTKYTYGDLTTDISLFDAVLIHWPEQLFNWKEPSNEQIKDLEKTIKYWKQRLSIVHVVHNDHPHNRDTLNFKKLYQLVLSQSDIIVHLGKYSKSQYQIKYPDSKHIIIEHPLYSSTMKIYDKAEARKLLNIKNSTFVVIVPGKVRTKEERKLILRAFKSLKVKNKLLVVPRMFPLKIKPFKGYYKLKKIIPFDKVYHFFANKKYVKRYRFSFQFINEDVLSVYLSASDVVFIPRFNNLNSGNTFLGLTFKKLILGPDNGNTKEYLNRHNMLTYDVNNEYCVSEKINKAYTKQKSFKITDSEIEYLHPRNISLKWDQLFEYDL